MVFAVDAFLRSRTHISAVRALSLEEARGAKPYAPYLKPKRKFVFPILHVLELSACYLKLIDLRLTNLDGYVSLNAGIVAVFLQNPLYDRLLAANEIQVEGHAPRRPIGSGKRPVPSRRLRPSLSRRT